MDLDDDDFQDFLEHSAEVYILKIGKWHCESGIVEKLFHKHTKEN